jgi:RNA polymerase sigma-70 factor (ECF subfamily)
MYKSYSDSELFDLLKSGSHAAFTEIYERYWKVMYVHTVKVLGEKDDAKDVVQELFANLWIKGNSIRYNGNLSGYLYVSAKNKIINYIQQKSTHRHYARCCALSIGAAHNTTIEYITEKELSSVVEKEIQNMPGKMQHIFNLSRKQNLSHKEIANKLAISDKTVKKQIGNAIRMIKTKVGYFDEVSL